MSPLSAAAGERTRAAQGGWSLIDLLLAVVFIALLVTTLQSAAIASLQALRVRQVADDLDETARIALDIMTHDIRDAGFGLLASGGDGLRSAGASRIDLASDLDLDGETSSSGERVGYEIDAGSAQLRRRAGGAAPQPMVDNLVPGSSVFLFRDESGAEISPATGLDTLDIEQRKAVRQIEIVLRLAAPHPAPGMPPIVVQHGASAGLRNADVQ